MDHSACRFMQDEGHTVRMREFIRLQPVDIPFKSLKIREISGEHFFVEIKWKVAGSDNSLLVHTCARQKRNNFPSKREGQFSFSR